MSNDKEEFERIYNAIKYNKLKVVLSGMRTTEDERVQIEDAFDDLYEEAQKLIK